jgi:uncharacterized coiled-coil protein SlyX
MRKIKTDEKLIQEIETIFEEGKKALLSLHEQKLALINKFKEVQDAEQASDILQKIKHLQ